MRKQWSIIFGLVFALLVALFAVINVDPVQVNFGFSIVSIPLILVILGCTLIGGLIVGLYGIFRGYKQQKTIKALTTELNQARDKIAVLESAPLSPSPAEIQQVPETTTPG